MPHKLCNNCAGFFSQRAEVCPNCGRLNYTLLIPTDELHTGPLVCLICVFSINRKSEYIRYIGGSAKTWKYRYNVGQIYCRRRRNGRGMWVSKWNAACEEAYIPLP